MNVLYRDQFVRNGQLVKSEHLYPHSLQVWKEVFLFIHDFRGLKTKVTQNAFYSQIVIGSP